MRAALTRSNIIEAAWTLLRSDGLEAVSLRRVAGSLGVTAPALYAHIDGKDDLLDAIADKEFDELDELSKIADGSDPIDSLRQMVRAYVAYASERPNSFQLLFRVQIERPAELTSRASHPRATSVFGRLVEPIARAVEAGDFRPIDPAVASLTMWTAAHGLATALQLGYATDDQDGLLDSVVDSIIDGFRAR